MLRKISNIILWKLYKVVIDAEDERFRKGAKNKNEILKNRDSEVIFNSQRWQDEFSLPKLCSQIHLILCSLSTLAADQLGARKRLHLMPRVSTQKREHVWMHTGEKRVLNLLLSAEWRLANGRRREHPECANERHRKTSACTRAPVVITKVRRVAWRRKNALRFVWF